MGSWQFGGGAVEDPAEHQIEFADPWSASPFDPSQYFTLPPPPIPPSVGFTHSYTRTEEDLYADRDAFEVSMGFDFQMGTLNRRDGHARIAGLDGDTLILDELPAGMAATDSSYGGPIPAGSRVAIHQGRNFGKSRLASLEVGRALRNVYGKFRSHGFAKMTDLAESLKSQPKEFLLLTTPAIRDRYAAALGHPQATRDRLGPGTYSYGAVPDEAEAFIAERRFGSPPEPAFNWQELPPVLT